MKKEPVEENLGTAYDDAYQTMINDCPKLIIPVINETFHKKYSLDEVVGRTNETYYINRQDGNQLQRIADSNIKIRNHTYHLECQSTTDGTMIVRMFEYGAQAALQEAELCENELTVKFPNAAILYLRHGSNTPEFMKIKVKVPKAECCYEVPVIKVQLYSVEELFEKQLFLFIPFHIFVYENLFKEYEEDNKKMFQLKAVYSDIICRLDNSAQAGMITEYEKKTIVTMAKKVLHKIAMKYSKVKEGIGEVMGGKVLEYEAKDILRQGISQGISIGEEKSNRQIAKKMLARNMLLEEISACTDLTIEQILELKD